LTWVLGDIILKLNGRSKVKQVKSKSKYFNLNFLIIMMERGLQIAIYY